MPDDDDPTLVLLRRMDGKLDRLLTGRADPGPQPAVPEPSAEGGAAGGDGQQPPAQPGPARPDADQAVDAMGTTSPDWPFASLQRVVDGQGRIEIGLARLLAGGAGRAAGRSATSASLGGELASVVAAPQREAQGLRADVAYLVEVFGIQHRAMRRDGDRISALECRVLDGRTP